MHPASFPLVLQVLIASPTACQICRYTSKSSEWPSADEWQKLNSTLSGRLLDPLPPMSVCHPDQPNFDKSLCNSVTAQSNSSVFYGNDPLGSDWPNYANDSCLPDPSYPCDRSGFPALVVNATSAQDIQSAVNFARERNIRLSVKATGHKLSMCRGFVNRS
ncbi:hypothetical protein B0J12DRAFT_697520 [Macrophomina phaseolina]|uniref:FAD linked oxidase n=1 Tax=Macrophomina phaseolina TaxID=35725 RepID=A0ABQ8GHG1_9PEZI|nr:hypothetical protein B0J12DRAFT_697520 [Macrophomina phaseolina]